MNEPELTGMTELTSRPPTKYLLLADEYSSTWAIPFTPTTYIEIAQYTEDDGSEPWRLVFYADDGDEYVSPLAPTRDAAIALLRIILESTDTLVDVAALPGWLEVDE